MPLIAAVILRFTGWNRTVCLCIVMVLGCSVATVISIFGVRYDRSPEMASKSVLQSNLLLPVTMPLMMVHRRTDLIRRDDYGLLFTPAKLGTCELKNRIVRSATNGHLSDEKSQVTPLWADTLIELVKNEVGLVITGHFCVDKMQRADAGQPVLDEATDESLLRRACDGVHRYGGKLFFQLSHSGIKGVGSVNGAPPKPPEDFTREELDRLVE